MAEIRLYCGGVVLVDDQDLPLVSGFNWTLDSEGYVVACTKVDGEWKIVKMHKLLFEDRVDHKNRNRTDNRRENMRFCTQAQNNANRTKTTLKTTSVFKGVCWDKQYSKWRASISVSVPGRPKTKHLGRFTSERDAALAYNAAASARFGEFACLNNV